VIDFVPEPAPTERSPAKPRLRVGWLGHKSETIGDGLRTYSREVTCGLARRGVEIEFVHHEASLAGGRSSHALKGHPVFQRRLTIAGAGSRRRLEELLRERAVDVVHLSAPFSTIDFRLPDVCRRLGIPLVVTFHVPFARDMSVWESLAAVTYRRYARSLSECDRVIVLGQAQRQRLIALGVPDDVIAVLPNGVDTEKYSPGPSAAPEWFNADRIFTFVGRIDPEKQVEALLKAFLEASPPDSVRLVLIGDGVDLARLKRKYRDRRIVFLGTVLDETRRVEILRGSDAFFLPSRVEAMSLALLEAMASGVAVAATGVGNHPEVIGDAGIVLRSSRLHEDLKVAIEGCLESPAWCRSLGARARERAVDRFSLEAHVDGLIRIYGEVVSRTSPAILEAEAAYPD
jgi:glycosyltransferase involved in cell wall biosynthesis